MKKDYCVVIPAVKKNVAFPDDLIKKLDGVPLVQRTINTAREIIPLEHIVVVTDSQEISLICERNGVRFNYKQNLKLTGANIIADLKYSLLRLYKRFKAILILYPYAPLVQSSEIMRACNVFMDNDCDMLVSVKSETYRNFNLENNNFQEIIFGDNHSAIVTLAKAFLLVKSDLVKEIKEPLKICPFRLRDSYIEIRNYQDWWICDKLLRRKRILFRVIGNTRVGMGHIYRSLTLANEITDHEILFVCDEKNALAVKRIAGSDYMIHVFPEMQIERQIIALQPDLVVNDMLNTTEEYIEKLKTEGIAVVNFEDIGTGAALADITFNELYDTPVIPGNNIFWGNQYFFLRDEFQDAMPRRFSPRVKAILIAYGGTDQHNLTMKTLTSILGYCEEKRIHIYIITGPGYPYKNELSSFIEQCGYDGISFTSAAGVVSGIMEQCDIAISSNGRTVYELCHMNIPSLIISQHEREKTHDFASEKKGFVHIGRCVEGDVEGKIIQEFDRLVSDSAFRKNLHEKMAPFSFNANKQKVVSLIQGLLTWKDVNAAG